MRTTAIVWLAIVALGIVSTGLALVVYQLAKQQGRLLLRLDSLDAALQSTRPHVPMSSNGQPAQDGGAGLPVGASAGPFRLSDLDSRSVGLSDFAGKNVLLINWSPTCGFCEQIAPELAALQEKLSSPGIQALLIAYEDAASNRSMAARHGLRLPILLRGTDPIPAFEQLGTPVAYLLDRDARVSKPLAIGADNVIVLARDAAGVRRTRLPGERPLSQSLVLRDGLKPGTAAPNFTLPDLWGRPVRLDAYRGRRVLLVFSDPQCGPCNELAPALAGLADAQGEGSPALLMVSRGDLEENRRKAREHGIQFPVVVQEQWKLSKDYGIFATPVAFLIDENGIIERPVARGKDEILALARQAGEREKELVG